MKSRIFFVLLGMLLRAVSPTHAQSVVSSESVLVTRDAAEVKGMTKVGEVQGRSMFFGLTAKKGEKDATKKLQKEAAALGATKVLIVHEEGMGSTTLKGIAYRGGSAKRTTSSADKTNPAPAAAAATSWESVMVTRDAAEVSGRQKLGEVQGRSMFFGLTAKKGEKDATKKLQQAAAALGASKVLITHEDTMGSTSIKGIAYK